MQSFENLSLNKDQENLHLCEKGNPVIYLCYNKQCENKAFVCGDKQCECRIKHKNDSCRRQELAQIQSSIQKKKLSLVPIQKQIDQMIEKLIDKLSEIRQNLIIKLRQKHEYSLLSQKQRAILKVLKQKDNQDKITCKFMWQYFKQQFDQKSTENEPLYKIDIQRIKKVEQQFQKQLVQYSKKLNKSLNVHLNQFFQKRINDLHIDNHGWIRIMMKKDNVITTDFKGNLTSEDIGNMKIKDIGWSDNHETMFTPQSWFINNVQFSLKTVNLPINQVIANIFNGKTPSGQDWGQNYQGGYLFYKGIIQTYGNFASFYMGWQQKTHITIGTQTTLRSGGAIHHTGQWIHSCCNAYSQKQHSITSRIGWKNTRVFWVRVE